MEIDMIPFARLVQYGNILPMKDTVINFFLDEGNATPTMWLQLSNGELWGTCSPTYAHILGLPTTGTYYGSMHLAKSSTKIVWGNQYGTYVLSDDNKLWFAGRITIFDGTSSNTTTWEDKTDFYSQYFDITKIKKIIMNFNTVYILLNDGSLYSHGSNNNGFFGLGNTTPSYVPILIKTLVQDCWITTSNGVYQDFSGKIWGNGNNIYRQLQTTAESTVYNSWVQLFSAATSASDYEYNALRVCSAHFMLFRKDGKYHCSGRNYAGAWGIGNINVDSNVALYNAQLSFVPGNLLSLFGSSIQVYWTNIITDINGVVYYSGNMDGGGDSRFTSFVPQYPVQGDGNNYRAYTNARMFALCELNSPPSVYAKGSLMTTSGGVGFTPLSTPLPETFTHITDFNLGE